MHFYCSHAEFGQKGVISRGWVYRIAIRGDGVMGQKTEEAG